MISKIIIDRDIVQMLLPNRYTESDIDLILSCIQELSETANPDIYEIVDRHIDYIEQHNNELSFKLRLFKIENVIRADLIAECEVVIRQLKTHLFTHIHREYVGKYTVDNVEAYSHMVIIYLKSG